MKDKIIDLVEQLQTFLECDLWYASQEEFVDEKHMVNYLEAHFNILKKQIKELQ